MHDNNEVNYLSELQNTMSSSIIFLCCLLGVAVATPGYYGGGWGGYNDWDDDDYYRGGYIGIQGPYGGSGVIGGYGYGSPGYGRGAIGGAYYNPYSGRGGIGGVRYGYGSAGYPMGGNIGGYGGGYTPGYGGGYGGYGRGIGGGYGGGIGGYARYGGYGPNYGYSGFRGGAVGPRGGSIYASGIRGGFSGYPSYRPSYKGTSCNLFIVKKIPNFKKFYDVVFCISQVSTAKICLFLFVVINLNCSYPLFRKEERLLDIQQVYTGLTDLFIDIYMISTEINFKVNMFLCL